MKLISLANIVKPYNSRAWTDGVGSMIEFVVGLEGGWGVCLNREGIGFREKRKEEDYKLCRGLALT
jgi:hypothetical protein